MKKKCNVILWGIFLTIFWIFYIFNIGKNMVSYWCSTEKTVGEKVSATESLYQNADVFRRDWINLYGLTQNVLQKRFIEGFTLCKTDYGKIVEPRSAVSGEEIQSAADNIEIVARYAEDNDIPLFYITSLLPVADASDLPDGITDCSEENAELLLQELKSRNIPLINLRERESVLQIPKEDLFYYTDHHWSMDSCFCAYQEIIKTLEEELQTDLDAEGKYTNTEHFDRYQKENCFLGSYGVKVGEFYAGKDDFVVYLPKFSTSFQFEAYKEHELELKKNGSFQEALMEMSYVEDEKYYNKYNSFSNGTYCENRITNMDTDSRLKVLFVSHSYGRSLAQYFALCFKEVRHLDPQKGRYNDNYLTYIDEYKPDLILILTEFEGDGYILMSVEDKE